MDSTIPASVAEESVDLVYHATTACAIIGLIVLYTMGVWLRSYVFPTRRKLSVKRQLLASIPVGIVTMALYAKSVFPGLDTDSPELTLDVSAILGYAILFGMMSRETLERFLTEALPGPALPGVISAGK